MSARDACVTFTLPRLHAEALLACAEVGGEGYASSGGEVAGWGEWTQEDVNTALAIARAAVEGGRT